MYIKQNFSRVRLSPWLVISSWWKSCRQLLSAPHLESWANKVFILDYSSFPSTRVLVGLSFGIWILLTKNSFFHYIWLRNYMSSSPSTKNNATINLFSQSSLTDINKRKVQDLNFPIYLSPSVKSVYICVLSLRDWSLPQPSARFPRHAYGCVTTTWTTLARADVINILS